MIFDFGEFELDTDRVELRRWGEVVHLEPKSYELLEYLVMNHDRVSSKDEIFDQIWPGVFVTEASLSGAIRNIRKALGDDGTAQRFIKTVRGRGFRFVADVSKPMAAVARTPEPQAQEAHERSGPPVVAILPFTSHGIDPEQSALGEAIPAELISALSKLKSMRVLARGTTFRLDPSVHDVGEIKDRLRVNYVLTGSVSKIGQKILVVVELVDTATHHVLWSSDFARGLDDLPSIEDEISRSVVNALDVRIPQNEAEALFGARAEILDAWGNYHLGVRHLYRFNAPDNAKAAQYFQASLRQDPGFARAVAGLSYTELENYNLGFGPEKAMHLSRTKEFAEKAVDLDPFDPFCNLVLSRAHWVCGNLDGAISWAKRSINLNSNYAFALYNLGKFNAIDCVSTDARQCLENAMSLSPLDAHMQSMLSAQGLAAFVENDAEAALQSASLSLRAPNPHLYVCLFAAAISASYGDTGTLTRAKRRIESLGGAFDRRHFTSLFELSDQAKQRDLMRTIEALGLSDG